LRKELREEAIALWGNSNTGKNIVDVERACQGKDPCMGKTRVMTVGGVMYTRLCEKHNRLIEITLRLKAEDVEKEEKPAA